MHVRLLPLALLPQLHAPIALADLFLPILFTTAHISATSASAALPSATVYNLTSIGPETNLTNLGGWPKTPWTYEDLVHSERIIFSSYGETATATQKQNILDSIDQVERIIKTNIQPGSRMRNPVQSGKGDVNVLFAPVGAVLPTLEVAINSLDALTALIKANGGVMLSSRVALPWRPGRVVTVASMVVVINEEQVVSDPTLTSRGERKRLRMIRA